MEVISAILAISSQEKLNNPGYQPWSGWNFVKSLAYIREEANSWGVTNFEKPSASMITHLVARLYQCLPEQNLVGGAISADNLNSQEPVYNQ